MSLQDTADDTPRMDYASHQRQFDRFIHVLKWFVIHALIMLPGLYFLIVGGQPVVGTLFVILAVAALGYGIFTTSTVARDVRRAVDHRRDAS
jgi:hypothetical protein